MTKAERYPNLARLTALLNQQKHPRRTFRTLVDLLGRKEQEGGAQYDTREHN